MIITPTKSLVISRTPVRISFFGGGTDYPIYYARHPGVILGTTINQYIHVTVSETRPFPGHILDHKLRLVYSKTELVHKVQEIQHPSIRECLKYMNMNSYIDVHTISDLPAKTGLGSSSAFTVGFLKALYAFQGIEIFPQKLAEEACFIEQKCIQEKVGSQDQFHAAFGGFNLMEFNASEVLVTPLNLSKEKIEVLENHLMVFYTGLTRFADDVLQEQIEKTKDCSNDNILEKMYEMAYEAKDLLMKESVDKMVSKFGKLLHESWLLKKQLSNKITNPFIDQAYEAAMQAGAYGGKLCGAGNGGFLTLFAPIESQSKICEKLKDLPKIDIRFEREGSSIIYQRGQ